MRSPIYTKQFSKDLKRMKNRGRKTEKIKKVMTDLIGDRSLDIKHRDHKLVGYYRDRRECHIEPDWLLIYKRTQEEIIFERTGTHSDLFD
ncbi:MAG: type II toxin-antitoxin system YafQ family toxin [Nitrospiria bacterium]